MKPVGTIYSPRFKRNFQLAQADLIGEGNFAQVYKLYDSDLKKTLAFRRVEKIESQMEDILKEKSINESLMGISSQYILPIFDIIELQNEIYYIIQFCNGGSLWDTLNELPGCKLPEKESTKLILQIGKGLQDLHHHKITHRDLKPQNILLITKYNPKKDFPDIRIADFGLSTTKLIMKTVAGTKEYLSPEQAKFASYTNAVDIWAMGIIFDEMLHGTTFYTGEDNKEVFHNICTIPYYVRDDTISPQIKQILISMLKKRPYERPILTNILNQLHNFLSGVKLKIVRPGITRLRKPLITDCWDIQAPQASDQKPLKFSLDSIKLNLSFSFKQQAHSYKMPELDPQTRRRLFRLDRKYEEVTKQLGRHRQALDGYMSKAREQWGEQIERELGVMLEQAMSQM